MNSETQQIQNIIGILNFLTTHLFNQEWEHKDQIYSLNIEFKLYDIKSITKEELSDLADQYYDEALINLKIRSYDGGKAYKTECVTDFTSTTTMKSSNNFSEISDKENMIEAIENYEIEDLRNFNITPSLIEVAKIAAIKKFETQKIFLFRLFNSFCTPKINFNKLTLQGQLTAENINYTKLTYLNQSAFVFIKNNIVKCFQRSVIHKNMFELQLYISAEERKTLTEPKGFFGYNISDILSFYDLNIDRYYDLKNIYYELLKLRVTADKTNVSMENLIGFELKFKLQLYEYKNVSHYYKRLLEMPIDKSLWSEYVRLDQAEKLALLDTHRYLFKIDLADADVTRKLLYLDPSYIKGQVQRFLSPQLIDLLKFNLDHFSQISCELNEENKNLLFPKLAEFKFNWLRYKIDNDILTIYSVPNFEENVAKVAEHKEVKLEYKNLPNSFSLSKEISNKVGMPKSQSKILKLLSHIKINKEFDQLNIIVDLIVEIIKTTNNFDNLFELLKPKLENIPNMEIVEKLST